MIERASRDSRIVPGDVLGSGTVSGGTMGEAMPAGYPGALAKPGDVVEIEVEGSACCATASGRSVTPTRTTATGRRACPTR